MKTETLNEFLFADLLEKHAQKSRRFRLEADPTSSEALTKEDLNEAFENLQYYRAQSKTLLANSEDID